MKMYILYGKPIIIATEIKRSKMSVLYLYYWLADISLLFDIYIFYTEIIYAADRGIIGSWCSCVVYINFNLSS